MRLPACSIEERCDQGARFGVGSVAAVGVLAALLFLPTSRWALLLVDWIRGTGATGVAVYALVYVAATLLFLPGSILTAGAGFAYGPLWGTLPSPSTISSWRWTRSRLRPSRARRPRRSRQG